MKRRYTISYFENPKSRDVKFLAVEAPTMAKSRINAELQLGNDIVILKSKSISLWRAE